MDGVDAGALLVRTAPSRAGCEGALTGARFIQQPDCLVSVLSFEHDIWIQQTIHVLTLVEKTTSSFKHGGGVQLAMSVSLGSRFERKTQLISCKFASVSDCMQPTMRENLCYRYCIHRFYCVQPPPPVLL